MFRPLELMSFGAAALAVSAGLVLASVPVVRAEPQRALLPLAAGSDCPFAGRLVISAPGAADSV